MVKRNNDAPVMETYSREDDPNDYVILEENEKYYLRYIHCSLSTVRYEIRERKQGRPDALIFWTHSLSVAKMHWNLIKDRS